MASNLESKINELEKKIAEQGKTLEQIKDAITGGGLTNDKGIVNRLQSLEQFVESFNKKKTYYLGYGSAILFMIGFVIALIKIGILFIDWVDKLLN